MEIRKSDLLKNEIRTIFNSGETIDYIKLSKKYEMDIDLIRTICNKEIAQVIKEKQERCETEEALLDTEGNIKTKESLAFLHDQSKKLIENAIDDGNYHIALQAMNTLSKQVELTMKKFGEFEKKDTTSELFPDDFSEFLLQNLKREGIIYHEDNKTFSEEQSRDSDSISESEEDSIEQ
jgi:hypothetical protein